MVNVYIASKNVLNRLVKAIRADWKNCYFEVLNEHELAFADEIDARNIVYILTKETHHRAKIIEN